MKAPQMDPEVIHAEIVDRVSGGHRDVFYDLFADQLSQKPSQDAWRELAEKDPKSWMQAMQTNANLVGYAQKTEHVEKRYDITELAKLLIAQKGRENARLVLEAMGAPTAILSLCDATVIEGKAEPADEPKTA